MPRRNKPKYKIGQDELVETSKKIDRTHFLNEMRAKDFTHEFKNFPLRTSGRRLPMAEGFIDTDGNVVKLDKTGRGYTHVREDKFDSDYENALRLNSQYDSLISKYGKDSRHVYNFEVNQLDMYQSSKSKRLEGTLAIVSLIGSIFFLSNNITGNIVGSLNQTSSNIIGACLFFLGVMSALLYFK